MKLVYRFREKVTSAPRMTRLLLLQFTALKRFLRLNSTTVEDVNT